MINFNQFKEIDFRIGKVKEVRGNNVLIDLGNRQVERNCTGVQVQPNNSVVLVVEENSAILLSTKNQGGKSELLTIDESVEAGALVE